MLEGLNELPAADENVRQQKAAADKTTTKEKRRRRIMTADLKQHKQCLPPGVQYIVTCKDQREQECYKDLEDHGVDIIHMLNTLRWQE